MGSFLDSFIVCRGFKAFLLNCTCDIQSRIVLSINSWKKLPIVFDQPSVIKIDVCILCFRFSCFVCLSYAEIRLLI